MVFGLPAIGETSWGQKVLDSINAVKATADAAQTAAGLDAAVAAKVDDTGTATGAALAASFERVLQANFDGTDETATLQAALTAAAGGTLRIPSGRTIKTGTVTIPANTRLTGGGTIDIIDDGTTTSRSLFIDRVDGVTIDGITVLSSNAVSRTGVYGLIRADGATNLTITNCKFGKSMACFVWVGASLTGPTPASNVTIAHNHGTGAYADGVHINRGATRVLVADNIIESTGDDAIAVNSLLADGATLHAACTDIIIRGNVVRNVTPSGSGIGIYGGSRITIQGNIVASTPNYGIAVQELAAPAGEETHPSSAVSILDNRVSDVPSAAIYVNGSVANRVTDLAVAGNTASSTGTAGGSEVISVAYTNDVIVARNNCRAGASGVKFNVVNYGAVTGNTCGPDLADTGINLTSCLGVAVTGNVCHDNNGGIYEPNGGPNVVVGNVTYGNTSFGVNMGGTGSVNANNI